MKIFVKKPGIRGIFLITFFLFFGHRFLNSTPVFKIIQSAEADLDGDGIPEKVSVSQITEHGDFLLTIDKISVKGKVGLEKVDGFAVVDIDTSDRYKEIAIHNPGPSDDDEYLIYWYDGKSIKEMGLLSRWPKFLGNGTVIVGDWMGFWMRKKLYVLSNETRTLKIIPQEFYYVGIGTTVKESFPLYETRNESKIVTYLTPKSKIFILLSDWPSEERMGKGWFLIKSEGDVIGWTRKLSHDTVENLPVAD